MKTDRELLELAAKASGRLIHGWTQQGGEDVAVLANGSYWQPLLKNSITDCDGDALRLLVALDSDMVNYGGCIFIGNHRKDEWLAVESIGIDTLAATRRAIVSAAAKIGETMP